MAMLLPSAFACESSQTKTTVYPKTRLQASLFASPPLSPPPIASPSSHQTLNNLVSTCRTLQSMLMPPSHLPSPPTTTIDIPVAPPARLRLRARKTPSPGDSDRRRIAKRTPPRGINKRRRPDDDAMMRDEQSEDDNREVTVPRTPKRARLAPEHLPLGLQRTDFHALHLDSLRSNDEVLPSVETEIGGMGERKTGEEWSNEEDRMLVELVLDKLKLSKSDWQDCARSLGKDRKGVDKRWRSLVGNGDVGLKQRPRRGQLHSTWR